MNRPLRFCMVTTFYPPYGFGGDAVYVQRLSHELAARGHEVDVVHSIEAYRALGGKAHDRPSSVVEMDGRLRIHGLRSPAGLLWPLAVQQTGGPAFHARTLRSLLDRDYDVIHYHNISLVGGPEVLNYGRAIKLYTMHEYWLVCPTHVLFRDGVEACPEPRCLTCTLRQGRPPQWWRYTGKVARAARSVDLFLALSRFSLDMHRARGLEGRMKVLPTFVPRPIETLPPLTGADAPENAAPPPFFLFAGRLERLKGLHTLIPNFPRDIAAELWIAGEGSESAALRRLAADHPRVRFLGHVQEPRLSALMRAAVALVMPSLCYEASPLVAAEAFRQGTPVIARRLGGMAEAVEDAAGGLLYDRDEECPEALRRLLQSPGERRRFGESGRAAYERDLTPEAHLERYFQLIEEAGETQR
jgi:glycosyltransferase involved in cell wall biosynthesis